MGEKRDPSHAVAFRGQGAATTYPLSTEQHSKLGHTFPRSAEVRVDVPLEECWEHWMDREKIPQWMPWISSVKVQAVKL